MNQAAEPNRERMRQKVLVVEDEGDIRELLRYNLAQEGFAVEEAALAKVGIQVTADTHDSSSYYSTWIGSPQNLKNQGIGIAFAAWGADFPTGVGFFQSITNGNSILPTGNSNYASLNDPTVNKGLDEAPSGKATEADWESLNNAIAQSARNQFVCQ